MQGKVQDGLGFPVSACKKQTFETEDADILDMGMDAHNSEKIVVSLRMAKEFRTLFCRYYKGTHFQGIYPWKP